MNHRSRAVADCSADPLRILLVESAKGRTEFTTERCERGCTIKRLNSLTGAASFLRTSLFQVLLVNDSSGNHVAWDELQKLQEEFPAVDFVVLTDDVSPLD